MYDQFTPLATIMEVLDKDERPFAGRLREAFAQRGTLTQGQFNVAVRMANERTEYLNRSAKREAVFDARKVDVSQTFAALDAAQIRIGRFFVGDNTEVKVKRNHEGTTYYATVRDTYVGSVTASGTFVPAHGKATTLHLPLRTIVEGLQAFGRDPRGHMMRYGHATGVCGVCGRGLSDPESVALGIGPICAGKLP